MRFFYSLLLKYIRLNNFLRFRKYKEKYKIIPFGCYCLPRVITTINGLKPTKKEGEPSFPFDLCFSDFECNVDLFANRFDKFYDDIEYDSEKKYWINKKYKFIFNHDNMGRDEFKKRYDNRIANLFSAIADTNKHLYFVIATFNMISETKLNVFIKEICKYRKVSEFDVIVINQSTQAMSCSISNVFCIDLSKDKLFAKVNTRGDWVNGLKKMKNIYVALFNYKLNKKISKIMRRNYL